MKATCLNDLVDSNPKALSADEIIQTRKTKLWSLKAQVLWSPAESNRLDMESDISGLNTSMNKMVESQKRG